MRRKRIDKKRIGEESINKRIRKKRIIRAVRIC
jgi:hypothetical protein